MDINTIYEGDCLEMLKTFTDKSINCCVTSPPYYGLRDYGTAKWEGGDPVCDHSGAKVKTRFDYSLDSSPIQDGKRTGTDGGKWKKVCPDCGAVNVDDQIGLEQTPEEYVDKLVQVFREVRRVLRDDGTLWLNLGDSYWGGGWRGASLNENSGDIQKGHLGTHCGETMPNLKGKVGVYKPKDLIGIPWMVAFALRADGWYLRQDIIWHKPNPMPESVTDRCTKAHEYIFLLSKSQKYYYDYEIIQEYATVFDGRKDTLMKGSKKYDDGLYLQGGNANSLAVKGRERWKYKNLMENGQVNNTMHEKRAEGLPDILYPIRNKRSVWTITTKPYADAHFATFPEELIWDCVKAGCPEGGITLDPFMGAGTTGLVCLKLDRSYIGIELNPKYIEIANKRIGMWRKRPKSLFKESKFDELKREIK